MLISCIQVNFLECYTEGKWIFRLQGVLVFNSDVDVFQVDLQVVDDLGDQTRGHALLFLLFLCGFLHRQDKEVSLIRIFCGLEDFWWVVINLRSSLQTWFWPFLLSFLLSFRRKSPGFRRATIRFGRSRALFTVKQRLVKFSMERVTIN